MLPDYIRPVGASEAFLTGLLAGLVLLILMLAAGLWLSARDQI
jgi:hypothetical protein